VTREGEHEPVDLLDSPEAGGTAIRGSLVRGGGFGATLVLGLVSAPVLTRHLGIEDFGRYATVVSLIALVGAVAEGGLNAFGVRELAVRPAAEKRRLMRNLLGIRLVLTAAGVIGALLFGVLAGYEPELLAGTVLAGVGLLAYELQGMLALPLAAQLRLGWLTIAEVVRQAVNAALIIALAVAGAGLVPLLGTPVVAGLVGAAIVAVVVRGQVPLRPRADRAAWRQILRQTLPIAAASAVYHVYFRMVILLMSVIATALATGYFAVSFRIIEIVAAIPFIVVGTLLPVLARAARDDRERLAFGFRRTFDVTVIAGAGMTVLGVTGAPLAIAFLTGDRGSEAVNVLRIQSLTLLPVFVNVGFGSLFVALHRHRELIVLNLTPLAVTLVAALVLVSAAEARGGAAAVVLGEVALLVAYASTLARRSPELSPSLRVVPRAVAAALVALGVAALVHVPHLADLADPVIAAAVYVGLLVLLRAIPRELLDALRHRTAEAGA
jgi:O-antigen/teichoic acid export membrane protein